MQKLNELFSSRFGLIATTLGMAIGAGNIWRFPRIAGQYGGSFLIPWLIFLFLWSIPLLIVEYSVGMKTRQGVLGAFKEALGKRYTWMGWFVAFCTTAIMFYYSVVSGWALKYFILAVTNGLEGLEHAAFWKSYTTGQGEPVFYHLLSLVIAASLIYLGVVKGIERFSKIIIPTLYGLLILSVYFALNLSGSELGLNYFLTIDASRLTDYKIWLDGLSQSAWSTGAGWGLILTYSIYARNKNRITSNVFITGFGNNLASVLAGLVIIPTIFALTPTSADALKTLGSGSQGLTFIAIPQLFKQISAGGVFSIIFFLALFFAALSSLISMLELSSRVLIDFGLPRKKATIYIALASAVIGVPSALSISFFDNQDWVWGLGLMISGAFFTFMVLKIGINTFVNEWLQPQKYTTFVTASFKVLFYIVIPLEFIAMLGWWLYQSATSFSKNTWDIFDPFSLGTTFFQWCIVILLGVILNSRFNAWLEKNKQ